MAGRGFPQGVVGRFQVVPADPGSGFARPVLAAGAVLWRWATGADGAADAAEGEVFKAHALAVNQDCKQERESGDTGRDS